MGEIPIILSCAGLLHDIGNPPFGHFGEFKDRPIRELLSEQMRKDLEHYEGNAQTFRILSKARNNGESYDVNLTYGVLNTLIKYPTDSVSFKATDDLKQRVDENSGEVEVDLVSFQKWMELAKKWLMYIAVYGFSKSYGDIMKGTYKYDLFEDTNHQGMMRILKAGAIGEKNYQFAAG